MPEGLSSRVYFRGRPAWEELFSQNVARRIRLPGTSFGMQHEIPAARILIDQAGRGEAAPSHSGWGGGPMAASGLQNIMVPSVEAACNEERRTVKFHGPQKKQNNNKQ